jgi:UDP-N-acetylglucosamine 4,6-dehydratase
MTVCLVTGATGTFGRAFLERMHGDWVLRAFSRDEVKQSELREQFPFVRWLIGDVRDLGRLRRACAGVDVVVHAAALKQVVSCEYNPGECKKTNVDGTENVAYACLGAGVDRAVFISSDKAVHPVNVYGHSKGMGEKLWLGMNAEGGGTTKFSAVRYGNVRGSRGSVLSILDGQRGGSVTLTDSRATRFWMDVAEAVDLVLLTLSSMRGGEVFVPKLGSALVADVISHNGQESGLRRGEKLHERLISDEEVGRTFDCGDHYRICDYRPDNSKPVKEGFVYSSEAVTA